MEKKSSLSDKIGGVIVFLIIICCLSKCGGKDSDDSNRQKSVAQAEKDEIQTVDKQSNAKEEVQNEEKHKVTLDLNFIMTFLPYKHSFDLYVDDSKVAEDITWSDEIYTCETQLTFGKHEVYCVTDQNKKSKNVTIEVDAGNLFFGFDMKAKSDNSVAMSDCGPLDGEFCYRCEDNSGRGYLNDDGEYTYVCDECAHECFDCEEYIENPKPIVNHGYLGTEGDYLDGQVIFLCEDCYDSLVN